MFLQSSFEIIFVIVVVFWRVTDFRFRKEALFVYDVGPGLNDGMNLSLVFGNLRHKFRVSWLLLLAVDRLVEVLILTSILRGALLPIFISFQGWNSRSELLLLLSKVLYQVAKLVYTFSQFSVESLFQSLNLRGVSITTFIFVWFGPAGLLIVIGRP
jgi:hypothetical protein